MRSKIIPSAATAGTVAANGRFVGALVYAKRDTKRNGSTVAPESIVGGSASSCTLCWEVERRHSYFGVCRCLLSRMCKGRVHCRLFDKALDELNRMYSATDNRTENR